MNQNWNSEKSPNRGDYTPAPDPQAELTRIFHSALVATRADATRRDLAGELYQLADSPAFKSILSAVADLAVRQGLGEREAAESVICTFRKMDQIWQEYLIQEGADRLRQATFRTP